MLSPGLLAAWNALRVMVAIKKDVMGCLTPFDRQRGGFAMGEGAAALILVSPEIYQRLGFFQKIRVCISGYAHNSDGHHITNPNPVSQARVMSLCLKNAGLNPQDIGYINAHGTATQAGDLAEARSVSEVFGAHGVPISSTKGLHGHLLGAGGAMELLIAIRALQSGCLPSSANCDVLDPEMTLDVIQKSPRTQSNVQHVMSNSFAFGGTNAVLIASAVR